MSASDPHDIPSLVAELRARNDALTARVATLEATSIATRTPAQVPPTAIALPSRLLSAISGVATLTFAACMTYLQSTSRHGLPGYPWPQVCFGLLGLNALLYAAQGHEWRMLRLLLPGLSLVAAIMWLVST